VSPSTATSVDHPARPERRIERGAWRASNTLGHRIGPPLGFISSTSSIHVGGLEQGRLTVRSAEECGTDGQIVGGEPDGTVIKAGFPVDIRDSTASVRILDVIVDRGPRKIITARQLPRICSRTIPVCSPSDSVLFTPKIPAPASPSNFSRSPIERHGLASA
jgi:hypothetical protein